MRTQSPASYSSPLPLTPPPGQEAFSSGEVSAFDKTGLSTLIRPTSAIGIDISEADPGLLAALGVGE